MFPFAREGVPTQSITTSAAPLGNVSLDKAVQPGFEKRRLRLADRFHLIDVAINPKYAVSDFSKARGAHAANVSQAHHNDVSLTIHIVCRSLFEGSLSCA
jgi:hypothetical protein